jgi:hypothetical protein
MTGRPTPSAVERDREMITQRSPTAIDDPATISTIGSPITRTARPSITPRARVIALQIKPTTVSFQARDAREMRRDAVAHMWILGSVVISSAHQSEAGEQ